METDARLSCLCWARKILWQYSLRQKRETKSVRKITAERMVYMTRSDALWDVFRATGYIGAYLLYKQSLETRGDLEKEPQTGTEGSRGVAGI